MMFRGEQIYQLMPQRPPIVMVDVVQSLTDKSVDTALTVKTDNIFVENGVLREAGMIEHIAQTAAIFAGYPAFRDGGQPRLGYIGELRKFKITALPRLADTLVTHLDLVAEAAGVTLVEAHTCVAGNCVAEGQMKVFLKDS